MVERTLLFIKPDGVQRGISGEIITRFEKVGLKIVGMKMVVVNKKFLEEHYNDVAERHGQAILNQLLEYGTMGPVIAMVLEGVNGIDLVRKMCGPTEPKSAAPGTIRGDFTHVNYAFADKSKQAIRNVVHRSGSLKEAEFEIYHWFNDDELFTYDSAHDLHILHKKKETE
jgi:nucleoside-diphosphate kinase